LANTTITNLPAVISLSGTEEIPLVQNGTTSRATVNQIGTAVSSNFGIVVGTTPVTNASNGYILYNNGGLAGVVGTTGTGNVVLSSSPTLTTPSLGVATATSLNGLKITTTTGTLTIPAATVAFSGAFPTTITTTGTTSVTLPTSGTLATTAGSVASFRTTLSGLTPTAATTGAVTLAGTLGVTGGGTGTGTAFTAGSVVFAGTSGVYSQKNAQLFWDNTNNRLGINTTVPGYALDVNGDVNFNIVKSTGGSGTYGGVNIFLNGRTVDNTGGIYFNSSNGGTIYSALAYSVTEINLNAFYGLISFQTSTAQPIVFRTNNSEAARFDSTGQMGIGTSTPNSKLDVSGNINGTSGSFGYLSTSTSTSTTPTLSFNASNTSVAKGDSIANSYVQDIIQNKSATSGASSNYVVSSNNGTDSTYYGEFGINSSAFSSGTPSDFFSLNNGVYFSGHDGDIAVGSGNGYKLYFPWGATPNNAHVLNASGALGFTTNLGTTLANSGTVGFGTAGQALITAGSSAAPAWGNVASPYSGAPLFGTGSDGNVTISSGTTTLTRDVHYVNLTLSGTGKIKSNGYNIYVSGTLDISAAGAAAISDNGNPGGDSTSSAGGAASTGVQGRILPPNGIGVAGATGTTTTGTAPSTTTLATIIQGGQGGAGASGGTSGTAQAGSAGGAVSSPTTTQISFPSVKKDTWFFTNGVSTTNFVPITPGVGGGGGGCGGGDAVNTGGGGGGGGSGGAYVTIYANIINRGTNTTASIIQSLGGNGGSATATLSGTAGGGGGGGAGGGGIVYIVVGTLQGSTITNAINVSGGTGGNGGNGASTGKGGNGGTGGNGGNYQIVNLSVPSFTVGSFNAAGTAGGTTSTSTGASGGAGATVQGNL